MDETLKEEAFEDENTKELFFENILEVIREDEAFLESIEEQLKKETEKNIIKLTSKKNQILMSSMRIFLKNVKKKKDLK